MQIFAQNPHRYKQENAWHKLDHNETHTVCTKSAKFLLAVNNSMQKQDAVTCSNSYCKWQIQSASQTQSVPTHILVSGWLDFSSRITQDWVKSLDREPLGMTREGIYRPDGIPVAN